MRVGVQGELIAENGTMAGGGNKASRGRMTLGSSAPRTGDGQGCCCCVLAYHDVDAV